MLNLAEYRRTSARLADYLPWAALVGAGGLAQVRLVGRATLCAGPEDIVRFEQVYAEWFAGRDDLRTSLGRPHLLRRRRTGCVLMRRFIQPQWKSRVVSRQLLMQNYRRT